MQPVATGWEIGGGWVSEAEKPYREIIASKKVNYGYMRRIPDASPKSTHDGASWLATHGPRLRTRFKMVDSARKH